MNLFAHRTNVEIQFKQTFFRKLCQIADLQLSFFWNCNKTLDQNYWNFYLIKFDTGHQRLSKAFIYVDIFVDTVSVLCIIDAGIHRSLATSA